MQKQYNDQMRQITEKEQNNTETSGKPLVLRSSHNIEIKPPTVPPPDSRYPMDAQSDHKVFSYM